jgi:hypothetical protein
MLSQMALFSAVADDRDEAAAAARDAQRLFDVRKRECAYAPIRSQVVVDAEGRVHHHGAGLVAFVERREVTRVVCGAAHRRKDIEQREAILIDLVHGDSGSGEMREEREHPGSCGRFEHEVVGRECRGVRCDPREGGRRRELLEKDAFIRAPAARNEQRVDLGEEREGAGRIGRDAFGQECTDEAALDGVVEVLRCPRAFCVGSADRLGHDLARDRHGDLRAA